MDPLSRVYLNNQNADQSYPDNLKMINKPNLDYLKTTSKSNQDDSTNKKSSLQAHFKSIRERMAEYCEKKELPRQLDRDILRKNVWHSEKHHFDYCGTPKGIKILF